MLDLVERRQQIGVAGLELRDEPRDFQSSFGIEHAPLPCSFDCASGHYSKGGLEGREVAGCRPLLLTYPHEVYEMKVRNRSTITTCRA